MTTLPPSPAELAALAQLQRNNQRLEALVKQDPFEYRNSLFNRTQRAEFMAYAAEISRERKPMWTKGK